MNSIAVSTPFTMDRDIAPGWASLAAFGGREGAEVEVRRYTVWSSDGLPRALAGNLEKTP